MGSGKQYMPVVALEDVVGAILFALENPKLEGPVNIVCPEVVTNGKFSQGVAHRLKQKVWLRIPAWVLKALGEQGKLMLASCRAVPQVLLDNQYIFKKPTLTQILRQIKL